MAAADAAAAAAVGFLVPWWVLESTRFGVVLVAVMVTQLFAGGGGCSFGVGVVELLSSSSSLDRFRTMSSSPLVLLPLFLVCCCGGRLFVMVYFIRMNT